MNPRTDQRGRQLVAQAFHQVREERSPDRVVADPELNARFLHECTSLGATQPARVLNRCLLNLRKAGRLPGLGSKKTLFADQEDYRVASEIAIRFLERRDGVTLDDVICNPARAVELDELATRIAPG